jgi:hypothetical protein
MAISTFRRNTKSEQKKGGGKGLRGNWREQMRLPKTGPTPFVLIKGEYTDPNPDPESIEVDFQTGQPLPSLVAYYKWLKHRLKTIGYGGKERFIDEPCSKGYDKHAPKPCAGCQAMDLGDKRITLGESYSMGLVHLKVYHRHPLVDPKTGPVYSKKDNSPVYVESECLEKQCNFCRALQGQPPVIQQGEFWPGYDPKTITSVFGSRRYLELGSGHLGDVGEWDKQISARCGGTAWVKDQGGNYILDQHGNAIPKGRCNTFLNVDSYNCSVCGNVLIVPDQDPRPLAQLEELAMKKFPCHHCQRPVFLKELNSCDMCGPTTERGGQAKVEGIFEGVLWGQRQGEGTNSHLTLIQFDSLQAFEQGLHPSARALLGDKTLAQRIEELSKPYDFAELYKPKALDAQAKRLEIQQTGVMQGTPGWTPPAPTAPGAYGAQPQQFMQAPGYPGVVPQGAPQGAPQPPQFQPYGQPPQSPGPAPFVPPNKPNFGA